MIRLIYSLTYLNARSAWRGLKGGRMTGWRGRMAPLPSVCLNEPTTTEHSTLRLFSIPSSIADNSRCCDSHGETLWEFHDPQFLRATRENGAATRRNRGKLTRISSLRRCLAYTTKIGNACFVTHIDKKKFRVFNHNDPNVEL